MDKTKVVLFLSLTVLASGCISNNILGNGDNNQNGGMESAPAQGKGLEVNSFTITDNELTPNQQAVVKLSLQNYHTMDIDIEKLNLYNMADLEVVEKPTCDQSIPASSNGLNPVRDCVWTIAAPDEDALSNFQSKSYNPRLMLRYNSRLTNIKQPMKISFMPGIDIESTKTVSKTFSNGEMTATLTTDSPIPNEGSANLEVELSPPGETHVLSDEYEVRIIPGSIIGGTSGEPCSDNAAGGGLSGEEYVVEAEPTVGKKVSFSCQISSEADRQVERNVIVSTFYKYQQSPALNIEVKSTDD